MITEAEGGHFEMVLDGFEGKLTSSKWATLARCSPDTALRDINELNHHEEADRARDAAL